jgi:sugar lactone lactonase YvrE
MKKSRLLAAGICLFYFATVKAQIITTVAGNGTGWFAGDGGPATNAEIWNPLGVAVDAGGNIYFADNINQRIRKVAPNGIITTVAGNGTAGFGNDGGPATSAPLNGPTGIAVDAAGNIYISDWSNHRIRKVSTSGIISTIAGNGTQGYSGDGGAATSAELYNPCGIAIDALGNVYFADTGNQRIRKISTSGTITTVGGNGTAWFSGDGGPATSAQIWNPLGLALDASGNIYFADNINQRIRKISTSGIITTVAGNGTAGFGSDGGPATSAPINAPYGVAIDAAGNLYIGDNSNNRIRQVNAGGIIITLTGNGTGAYSGDGAMANAAQIYHPCGVATDAAGNLYIADQGNQRIRKVTSTVGIKEINGQKVWLTAYPNPTSGTIIIDSEKELGDIMVCTSTGKVIYKEKIKDHSAAIDLSARATGIYFVCVHGGYLTISKE